MRFRLVVALSFALSWSMGLSAMQSDALAALKGRPALLVVVDDLDPHTGIAPDALRREIEQWMQKAGIRTLTLEQFQKTDGHPALYISVDDVEPADLDLKGLLLFQVRVSFYQSVLVQRLPGTLVNAPTWNGGRLGYVTQESANGFIRTQLHEVVDRFVAAYQEANANLTTASTGGRPSPGAQPAGQAAKGAPAPTEAKRLASAARTLLLKDGDGAPELRAAIERELALWGRFMLVTAASQADVILTVTLSDARVAAVLQTGDGTRLWDTVTGAETFDDGTLTKDDPAPDRKVPKMGEAIVDALHAFVGQ